MSFGFGIGDIIAVSKLANQVRKRFVDSPDQFKAISDEVKSLSNVLRDVEDVLPERDITPRQQQHCQDHIRGCENVLKELDKIIDKYKNLENTSAGFSGTSRRLWKRLKFEPEDVRDLRLRLISNIGLWNSFTGTLSLGLSQSTNDGVVRLNQHQNEEHLRKVAEWLSNSDYPAQQSDLINRCQEGTGQWLLDSEVFQAWLDGTESTLFCPGIPGAGKTMITSIMINSLQQRFQGDHKIGIAYIYCNYKRHTEQTLHQLMASLLKQLVQQQPNLSEYVSNLYSGHNAKRTNPSVDELCKAIRSIACGLARVFIIVDALDECTNVGKTRSKLLQELLRLQTQQNICCFATSRFIPDITAEFRGVASLEIRATDGDIQAYLEDRMSEMPACVSRNRALQESIQAEIVKSAGGMFLLAQLHLAGLFDKVTAKEVKTALQTLPQGSGALKVAYAEALERIKAQRSGFRRLAETVLSWIVCTKRSMTILELRHALAVEDNASQIAEDNFPEADEMVSVCAGMVTTDEDSGIIRLVHLTMQEYFEGTLQDWAPHAQTAIARTCFTYLSFDVFSTGPCLSWTDLEERIQRHPLFDYAARYWGAHVESAAEQEIERVALGFLENENNVASICEVVMEDRQNYFLTFMNEDIEGCKAIHLSAFLGLKRLVLTLLRRAHWVNLKDGQGRTPLSHAAKKGHEVIVRILLNQPDVEADCQDAKGRTALSHASINGHKSIFQILLDQPGVNAECEDAEGRTPLSYAAEWGHESVVRILLDQPSIDTDCEDDRARTPLSYAAEFGHEAIVRILLDQPGVDADCEDDEGRTPLSYAADAGHEAIVQILLEQADVNPDHKYNEGGTPLSCASFSGRLEIARLLMKRKEVNINLKNRTSFVPLVRAVYTGQEAMITLLLEGYGLRDHEQAAPLIATARLGHDITIPFLLHHGQPLFTKDKGGEMTIHQAAGAGQDNIVLSMLAKDENQLNVKDVNGKTALMHAALYDKPAVAKVLLERDGICINEQDKCGRTSLMYAACWGDGAIMKLLLERNEIQINIKDRWNRTAVENAAKKGRGWAVELLLERKEVDLDMNARTLRKCSRRIVEMIEEAKDRKYGGRDEPCETPS